MKTHSKYFSIAEFCEKNGIERYKFYKILHRHPELARKIRTSTAGERMLDEQSIKTAKAIFRKENSEDRGKLSANAAAGEINILAFQVDELREEVERLRAENKRLKDFVRRERKTKEVLYLNSERIAAAVMKKLGRNFSPGYEKRLAEYLSSCEDFKIFMDSKTETEEE